MTIRKGEAWGEPVERPSDLPLVTTDAGISRRYAIDPARPVGLSGGDLFGSLGCPPPRDAAQRLPIDLLEVTLDGVPTFAAAHVVLRRGWWRGPVTAVMNVDRIGEWNVAPRAHPNDGRFDVVTVAPTMSVRDRWQARKRLPSGTHLPHPEIEVRTATDREFAFGRPVHVWVDGVRVADATSVTATIRPDAFAVVV